MAKLTEERKFPLIVWEHTEESKREYEEAKKRFDDLRKKLYDSGFRCGALCTLRFDFDGYPEVWLNEWRNYYTGYSSMDYRMPPNPEEAIKAAKMTGDTGWWNFEAFEQLLEGKGPMFERAMFEMGYRRHKNNPQKWVKFSSKAERDEIYEKKRQEWQKTREDIWVPINDGAYEWVLPNEWAGLDKTYSLEVRKRGLIFVRLEFNPFYGGPTEGLGHYYGPRMSNRGHIARRQEGFYIDARNVRLGKEKGIHIKAVRPDETYAECIWPSQTPQQKIYDLADDLVSRVNSISSISGARGNYI